MKYLLIVLFGTLLLSGCNTSLVVKGDYPKPIAHKIPVSMALVLRDEFRHYQYVREENSQELKIDMGAAQSKLFEQISSGLFNSSQLLNTTPPENSPYPGVDMVLVPNLEEVQVATPKQTKLKVYEVWIQYNLQVFNDRGQPIADWIMTAYGKTPSRTLTSDSKALNLASVAALRDAGTRMVTGFDKVPEISQWLKQRQAKLPADLRNETAANE